MRRFYDKVIKRAADFLLALFALLVLAIPLGILSVLVKTRLGSPVLFRQERPGKNGEIFTLYKFRTMTDERDGNGNLLPDEVRLTKFGRLLRNLSLDELPEFYNILKGDMSFVGPRPLLVRYLPLYSERQAMRHNVRPGLTGLAQVNGRNLLTWEEKFEWDVKYVENISPWLDIKILFKTVLNVLKREGISSETSATMEEFKGVQEADR
ncbi:MAG: sugar transferase [Clostridia bacterium]|nr:sugar transferase [Clostridia bacterium]